MGLFDKLRNSDREEVELKPPQNPRNASRKQNTSVSRQRQDGGRLREEVELSEMGGPDNARSSEDQRQRQSRSAEEDSDDEFLLPGMKAASDDEDSSDTNVSEQDLEKMEQILAQNERIIELLEDIAGGTPDSDEDNDPDLSDTNIW